MLANKTKHQNQITSSHLPSRANPLSFLRQDLTETAVKSFVSSDIEKGSNQSEQNNTDIKQALGKQPGYVLGWRTRVFSRKKSDRHTLHNRFPLAHRTSPKSGAPVLLGKLEPALDL